MKRCACPITRTHKTHIHTRTQTRTPISFTIPQVGYMYDHGHINASPSTAALLRTEDAPSGYEAVNVDDAAGHGRAAASLDNVYAVVVANSDVLCACGCAAVFPTSPWSPRRLDVAVRLGALRTRYCQRWRARVRPLAVSPATL